MSLFDSIISQGTRGFDPDPSVFIWKGFGTQRPTVYALSVAAFALKSQS